MKLEELVDGPTVVGAVRTVAGWRWMAMTDEQKRAEWLLVREALNQRVLDEGLELVSDIQAEQQPNEKDRSMWLVMEARAVRRG